jgi:FkbM family methyltransferase
MQSLTDRRVPMRTRLDLLAADVRSRWSARELYRVRYGHGRVYLSHADFRVDRKSFDFAVVEGSYATDYDGAVVLDLGAHKGYVGAYAAAHGARAIVAYEPESANLAVLERTAAGYRDAQWTIRHAAVDAVSGRADLHVMGASWGHTLEPPEAFAEHEVALESVEVVALADVLADVDELAGRLVVKVNIEGAECSAILGTAAECFRNVAEVFVETHPWAPCDAEELAAHLAASGLTRVESAHPAVLRMRRSGWPPSGRRTAPR